MTPTASQPKGMWENKNLPSGYARAVYRWVVVLGLLLSILITAYLILIFFGVQTIADLNKSPMSKNTDYFFPMIVVLAGTLLLLIFFKALTNRPNFEGVLLESGEFPELEAMVTKCAHDAGIAPPQSLYIKPDFSAAAYTTGGLSSMRDGKLDCVLIGAPTLLLMRPPELEAIILHELAHISLRRESRAVNLSNKIRLFLPQFCEAHRRAGCWVFIFTYAPYRLLRRYWKEFKVSMNGFSQMEEFAVDSCAADVISARGFSQALLKFSVLQRALEGRSGNDSAILTRIHSAFHSTIDRSAAEEHSPNWFAVARRTLLEYRELFWTRIEMAKDELIIEATTPEPATDPKNQADDTHPELAARIAALGYALPTLLQNLGMLDHARHLDTTVEENISNKLSKRLRPQFFAASTGTNLGDSWLPFRAQATLQPTGKTVFACQYGMCARHGQPEITLREEGLSFYKRGREVFVAWDKIRDMKVITQSASFLADIAVNLIAVLRGLPSNRTLVIRLWSGSSMTVPHWHLGKSVWEVEALIQRSIQSHSANTGHRPALAMSKSLWGRTAYILKNGLVFFIGFALIVGINGLIYILGGPGSAGLETLTMILFVSWLLGRRR